MDITAYNEQRLNMGHKLSVNGFNQLYQGGEAAIQSVVAHNVHENIGQVQEGGTCLTMYGPLREHLRHEGPTRDKMRLGRCLVLMLDGDGVQTRVVCGDNPCYNNNPNNSTTYQQHRQYFQVRNENQCPRTLF